MKTVKKNNGKQNLLSSLPPSFSRQQDRTPTITTLKKPPNNSIEKPQFIVILLVFNTLN